MLETKESKQVTQMSEWINQFITKHKYVLSTEGISPSELHGLYCNEVKFPLGVKAFAPMLHLCGLSKIRKGNGYVYVVLD